MLYRKMNKTGDTLSILGYGCMRFPEKRKKIDKEKAKRQIYNAIDQGVNYFDTGFIYHSGESEPFLGEVLTKEYKKKIKIATKLPINSVHVEKDMEKIIDNQLKKLKVDCIDYYLLHGLDKLKWAHIKKFDFVNFLNKIKKKGKAINTGFSFHDDMTLFKEIINSYDWHFCQIQYNYLDELHEAGTEGIEYAAKKGLGIIIMEPLRGGTLTFKIPKQIEEIWNESGIKRTPAEWALRWLWNKPEITTVLSGMNVDEHINENLKTANQGLPNSLTSKELSLFKRVKDLYHQLLEVKCTGCRYCMPCPAGVNIPICFDLYNRVSFFKDPKFMNTFKYGYHLGGFDKVKKAYASQCKNCGKCIEKCPQKINIPLSLKKVSKEFEDFTLLFLSLFINILIYSKARK